VKNTKNPERPAPSGAQLLRLALTRDGDRPIFDATGCLDGATPATSDRTAIAAAAGAAAASGRAGVALLTGVPGLSAVAGIPVVLVVISAEPVELTGVRWSVAVPDASGIPRCIQQALRNTLASAPGPVIVSLHPDLLTAHAETEWIDPPRYPALEGAEEDVEAAASALAVCQSPVLILGQQWRFSAHPEALRPFVVRMELPCFALGCAAGALPPDSRFSFSAGLPAAVAAADLVLTVGISAADPVLGTLPAHAFLVQIDLDPDGHSPAADVAIRADAGRVMAKLEEYREDDGWLLQVRAFEQAAWEALPPGLQAIRESLSAMPEHVVVCESGHDALPPSTAPGRQLHAVPGSGAPVARGAGQSWPGLPVVLLSGDPPVIQRIPPVSGDGL
jgi:thiamine pyrophosphate-dependent acetolactate synthase large subunit-like protein